MQSGKHDFPWKSTHLVPSQETLEDFQANHQGSLPSCHPDAAAAARKMYEQLKQSPEPHHEKGSLPERRKTGAGLREGFTKKDTGRRSRSQTSS